MLPVTGVQNHISVFISHCAEDNDEAKRWERLLKKVGFDVLQYGHSLLPGDKLTTVASQIERCNFFLLLVSDLSVKSRWVQQELGLALEVQNRHGSYRPLIIPLYTKTWSSDIDMDTCFPTREFYSGETRADFPIGKVRGLNRYRYPKSDSDKILINMMMPAVLVSRSHFSDEDTFIKTGVFTLYNELFPEIERDSSQDIVDWVLRRDTGEPRRVPLSGGTEVVYKLDSRFFILVLAGRAIGFAFVTYDFTNRIVYGNYMAVQECWRSGGSARAFARRIEGVLRHLFPEYIGTVFEVETLDENDLERIISELEARDDKEFGSEQDRTQMRRFLRLIVYQSLGCQFFLRRDNKRPAVCRSPCLDVSQSVSRGVGEKRGGLLANVVQ